MSLPNVFPIMALGLAVALAISPATAATVATAEKFSGSESVQIAEVNGLAVVGAFYDTLLATMKEGPALKFVGRFTRLTPAVNQAFDMNSMTRIASGAQWSSISPVDRARLVEVFTRFSISNYASNFDSFDGEKFEILREVAAPGGGVGSVIVETQLILKSGKTHRLGYLLRPSQDGLRIIDVIYGGISELAARRSEFASVLNSGGANALYEQLELKTRELGDK